MKESVMKRIHLLLMTGFLLLGLPAPGLPFGGMGGQPGMEKAAPALPEDYSVKLQVPAFSELFSATPVALVDGKPVLLGELTPVLADVRTANPRVRGGASLTLVFNEALDRLIEERTRKEENAEVEVYAERSIGADRTLVVNVPIFSPHFIFTPVAAVAGNPIPMGEFARELGAMHAETEEAVLAGESPDNPAKMLRRLVTVRLVEQEARNMALDQQGMVQRQVAEFAEKTLLYELLGRQVQELELDRDEADRIYREISLAAKLDTYRFQRQEDAVSFLKQLEDGGDFAQLIEREIAAGKAVGEEDEKFVPLKKLREQVATAANKMQIGEVSKIYPLADGFIVFRLEDRKFIEDPAAREMAEKITWEQQMTKKSREYIDEVISQYAVFNEEVQKDFDFSRVKKEHPGFQLADALKKFGGDQRVLVSVKAGDGTRTMQVNELVEKLKATYFHGTEIELNAAEADKRVKQILDDWIFRIAGTEEAKKLGLDQTRRYQIKVEEFERRTLFDQFMQKVIVPEVKLTEEEVRQYYDGHLEEYSTPRMLRMASLAFYEQDDALSALGKLRKGSDFKWVSANSEGLVPVADEDLLDFGSGILSLSALPADLQDEAEKASAGDSALYSDPESFNYVIYFEKIFPVEPKPYDQVRSQILKILYQKHVQETLDAYVDQLKEHYPTEIYLKAGNS
jgi:hypothetical protein